MSTGCPFSLYLQNNLAKDISGMYPELRLPTKAEGEALGLFLTEQYLLHPWAGLVSKRK